MPYVTFAERYAKKVGQAEGRQEAIEVALDLRFPASGSALMPQVRRGEDLDRLQDLLQIAKTATLPEIEAAIEATVPPPK